MTESTATTSTSSSTAGIITSSIVSFTYTWVLRFTTISIGFVIIAGSLLYNYQDSLLYFPEISGIPRKPQDNPRGYRSPEERNMPFESHMITCSDGVQIHAWLLHAPIQDYTTAPTIIFFHGNAGNIGLRIPNAIQMLQQLQCNILMVEYRGYGNSDTVKINEVGIQYDAEAALVFVHEHTGLQSSKIFIFGRSLGGSVAIYLAHVAHVNSIPFAGVIVENTYTSISDMVDIVLPFLSPIKKYVLRIGWNSLSKMSYIGQHNIPILFLAGKKDELVPHTQMIQLFETAAKAQHVHQRKASSSSTTTTLSNLIRIHVIPNGTHNESWLQGGTEYWDAIRNFISTVLQQQQGTSTQQSKTYDNDMNSKKYTFQPLPELSSSIPIMSKNVLGMVKDATVGSNTVKKEL